MSEPVVRAEELTREYAGGGGTVVAVDHANLDAYPGELLVVRGPSGSGKTTLLNLLGGLDRPTSGRVVIGGRDLGDLSEGQLVELRRSELGYVFQGFGLIQVLSAAENIEIPLRIQGVRGPERAKRVSEMLDRVGLADHAAQRPAELSGGQQQRVGLARALAGRPTILIADEPTGQLDSGTAESMMELMSELVHAEGIAAIVSTHDPMLMSRADRVLELHDGHIGERAHGRHALPVEPV